MSDTTQTMRERMGRELDPIAWSDRYKPDDRAHAQQHALATIDAILREMMEPSEQLTWAGGDAVGKYSDKATIRFDIDEAVSVWRAMIQHILDEGKTVRIPMEGKVS